jgi:nucleoside-diphosphate-sugar epimerase
MKILIAGSSGFYGKVLTKRLQQMGFEVFGIDLVDAENIERERFRIADISESDQLNKCFNNIQFDAIVNLAAFIDFNVKSQKLLFENNVNSCKNLAEFGVTRKIKRYIYTSSNSIFLGNKPGVILQNTEPFPMDSYGKSKVISEKILEEYQNYFSVIIVRCPNIIDAGRFGMLTILFELIANDATLWVIDGGKYKHQCIYAQDLNDAILSMLNLNLNLDKSYIFNIGADGVEPFKKMFEEMLKNFQSKSKIRSLAKSIIIPPLKVLHFLGLSPMGPYQFRMLTSDFEFDTKYIKSTLNWRPTLTTREILELAYLSYIGREKKCDTLANNGANAKPIRMGILNLLKYIKF